MGSAEGNTPQLKDLTTENITENVKAINDQCSDPRLKYVLERLVQHVHDFARETRLSYDEWMTGIHFLTAVGQKCTDVRQEFILLSDILGLSLLVDSIDHPKPPESTEGTVLGPFHSHEAEAEPNGAVVAHDPDGEPCLVVCTIKDMDGKPIDDVQLDFWEADSHGKYDVQYAGREGPDQRAVLRSDKDGGIWFKAIVPVPYPVPYDGPVGKLLKQLGRHCYRPAHLHFWFSKEGYDNLITALYLRGSLYEHTDAVFGVKESLLVDVKEVNDAEMAKKYEVKQGSKLITYDFVLITEEESQKLREKKAMEAMEKLGRHMKIVNGLPVPDVD